MGWIATVVVMGTLVAWGCSGSNAAEDPCTIACGLEGACPIGYLCDPRDQVCVCAPEGVGDAGVSEGCLPRR